MKTAYDAIEQAVSGAIVAREEWIPGRHSATVNTFLGPDDPRDESEEQLLDWLRRRSDAQEVEIRGDEVTIPHEHVDEAAGERSLADTAAVLTSVTETRAAVPGTQRAPELHQAQLDKSLTPCRLSTESVVDRTSPWTFPTAMLRRAVDTTDG